MRGEPGKTDAKGRTGDQTLIDGSKPTPTGRMKRSADPIRTAVWRTDVPVTTAATRNEPYLTNRAHRRCLWSPAMNALINSNLGRGGRRLNRPKLLYFIPFIMSLRLYLLGGWKSAGSKSTSFDEISVD